MYIYVYIYSSEPEEDFYIPGIRFSKYGVTWPRPGRLSRLMPPVATPGSRRGNAMYMP